MCRTVTTINVPQTVQPIRVGAWVFIEYIATLACQQCSLAQCTTVGYWLRLLLLLQMNWLNSDPYSSWAQFIGQRCLNIIHYDGSWSIFDYDIFDYGTNEKDSFKRNIKNTLINTIIFKCAQTTSSNECFVTYISYSLEFREAFDVVAPV